jgi:peptide/nickel transport system permease protein
MGALESETAQVPESTLEEERVAVATQWQLMWWRFRKHKLALLATLILLNFYVIVIGAGFFAYTDPFHTNAYNANVPPQPIHLFDEGRWSPYVCAVEGYRDEYLRKLYRQDCSQHFDLQLFARGFEYRLFGLFPIDRHLIGVEDAETEEVLFLLGTDKLGRDLFSRLIYGTRVSLTVGLVGVGLSLFLGSLIGGVSGLYGGGVDTVIQRLIEILRSLPTIPLWLGLAAALPDGWSVQTRYFIITVILSIFAWTGIARVVRGRFLSLREEDFITAAELAGCSRMRIIFRHMLPSFTSYLIAQVTLEIPRMIVAETSLSFLGLGLRPPAISWGVLLQDAQNIQNIANTPWLLYPALLVIVAITAFSFLGDGLRDAADPYGA